MGANARSKRSNERRAKKRLVRAGLGCALATLALVAVTMASGVLSSLEQSDAEVAIFNDAAELPPALLGSVTWVADPAELPREMEPLTRDNIEGSWLRAWEQMSIVSATGDTSGVEVYFANSARRGVLERADSWGGVSVKQLGHELELTFYSEDGQIVGIRSNETRLQHRDTNGEHALIRESIETYEAVLVLEDGNWRVHHWVRRSVEVDEWEAVNPESVVASG